MAYKIAPLTVFYNITMLFLAGCSSSISKMQNAGITVHTFRRAYANTHVLKVDHRLLMIDSGGYLEAGDLEEDLIKNHLDPKVISGIIVTHGHWDHAAGARYFQEKYGTPVFAGRGDENIISKGQADPLCPTSWIAKMRKESDEKVSFVSPSKIQWIDKTVKLSDLLPELSGFSGFVIPAPSHTKGSLVIKLEKFAFVGDLFRGSLVGSSAVEHFYICDKKENKKLIQNLSNHELAEVDTFFTGHFGPVNREALSHAFDINMPN